MITAHAAVPRWPHQPPGVDETGREFVLVGVPRCPVVDGWAEQLTRLGRPCRRVEIADLQEALEQATVGVRVMIAGAEADVLAAAARCRAAGLADVELTLHATTSALRNVYCAHCTATSLLEAQVEDVVTCPSCRRRLTVFAHASARWGAYLGFAADAEERC